MDHANAFVDIGRTIQLSVTPVFLLVAIGSMLNVMTTRLGRVVDRARKLEEEIAAGETETIRALRLGELQSLDKRMLYSNRAINFCAVSALFNAVVVVLLFVGELAGADLSIPVALLFIIAMLGVIGGLVSFLAEISVSMKTIRVRTELLKGV